MNNLNHININYITEFIFFFLIYLAFGYFAVNLTGNDALYYYISLIVFGIIYSILCSEIFTRYNIGYYLAQAIAIPMLLLIIAINYSVLILIA